MFFAKELAGEPPLERGTAERLFSVGMDLFHRRFWTIMTEDRLLALGEEEMLYLHATGVAGDFVSLSVYRGQQGLAFLNRVRRQEYRWSGDMVAEQNYLRLRYAFRGDLRRADLKMLHELGLPKGKVDVVPEFSSARPGYHDWHVNNDEGLVLAKALEIFDGFLVESEGIDPMRLWPFPESCPWLRFGSDGLVRVEQVPLEVAAVKKADWTPPAGWPGPGMMRRGTWELGCFHPATPVGKAKERKSITQLCVVVDADTGMALHHELDQTSDHELMGLWKTIVGAVAQMGHLPKRLRVGDEASAAMFRALGLEVEHPAEMRSFEAVRESMLGMLGDVRLDLIPF